MKYILTFFFILWILFESLFFRFYLVDTPLDTKMFQDRKEFRKSRFIPIIGFEALSFYNRPFWRTFNNIMVFLSNLEAVFWIIFYVYILDFFFVLKLIYNFVFKFFSFLFFIITFFFFKVNFLLNHLFFVLLIFFWRIFFFIKKIFVTLNYLFILPFVLFLNFFNFIFKFFYNLYFFFKILNLKTDFKSEVLNSNKKNFQVSNNFVFFFDKVFFFCVFLENFICYLNYKLILFDLYNYKYFVYKNFFSFFTIFLKRFSFILKFLFYFYLFCCYFILFIFLFIIFYSYFYLPFFV